MVVDENVSKSDTAAILIDHNHVVFKFTFDPLIFHAMKRVSYNVYNLFMQYSVTIQLVSD